MVVPTERPDDMTHADVGAEDVNIFDNINGARQLNVQKARRMNPGKCIVLVVIVTHEDTRWPC